MKVARVNCADCGKQVIIKEHKVWRQGRSYKVRRVVGGYLISRNSSSGLPICLDSYDIITKILQHKELFFRNTKGQIQKCYP